MESPLTLILIKNFNNYYNRKIVKHDNYSEYIQDRDTIILQNINFNENDGVTTSVVVNGYDWKDSETGLEVRNDEYDYALLLTSTYNASGENEIKSRWWITDVKYTRNGQRIVSLLRDCIADYFDEVCNATSFIDRAKHDPLSYAPYQFSPEAITVNQIKKEEIFLTDETGCPWIVGYAAKDANLFTTKYDYQNDKWVDRPSAEEGLVYANDYVLDPDWEVESIDEWEYVDYINEGVKTNRALTLRIDINTDYENNAGQYNGRAFVDLSTGSANWVLGTETTNTSLRRSTISTGTPADEVFESLPGNNYVTVNTALTSFYDNGLSAQVLNSQLNGKYIRVGSVTYKIGWERRLDVQLGHNPVSGTSAFEVCKNFLRPQFFDISSTPNNSSFTVIERCSVVTLTLSEAQPRHLRTWLAPSNNRNHCNDAPYDIFCIPFGNVKIQTNEGEIYSDKEAGWAVANAITGGLGRFYPPLPAEQLWDVQILPYCPIRNLIDFDAKNINAITNNDNYDSITGTSLIRNYEPGTEVTSGAPLSAIFWAKSAAFSFNVNVKLESKLEEKDSKLSSICEKWRMCSPNFASAFDIDVNLNGGTVEYFNADCFYKPFNPYIHINPNFNLYYGQDFNDARGLMCGGDFSLARLNSAWAEYEYANKNYEALFNRGILSMTTEHGIALQEAEVAKRAGWISGAASGATSGAMAGAMMGNPWIAAGGAIIGGVAGGLTSNWAGGKDIEFLTQRQAEQLSYATDIYNLQLGNIQAMNTTISRTSAFTPNNKYIPIVEYYCCSNEEIEIVKNTLRWNGSSIGIIDNIKNWLGGYLKAHLIRIDVVSDSHVVGAIANELARGVFIE